MKLKKAVWDLLPKELKETFKPVGEGKTEADAEEFDNGEEAVGGLKSALEKERKAAADLKAAAEKAAGEKTAAELEAAKKAGDIVALEKSWKEKAAADVAAEKAKADKVMGALRKQLVDSVAAQMAGEVSTVPDLLRDQIAKRLGVDLDGDMPATRVLDSDGKPSALSLEDLKKEILDDKRYSAILKGVDSSGGGAGTGRPGAGGFKLDNFKNTDGSVNWSAVNKANQADPTILKQVQDAVLDTQRGGSTGAVTPAAGAV